MKKVNNQSYNRIIQYLEQTVDIDESEKRYLFYYATQLYKNNIENIENENINDIYASLREFVENIEFMNDTTITKRRINEVLDILQEISFHDISNATIREISYRLDKLYSNADLPMRKNSSLSYNLLKSNGRKK